jgi:hypothetical protein
MVFGNSGVFADGDAQKKNGQIPDPLTGQVLSDIENMIVSAFNRGVANLRAPAGQLINAIWNDNKLYYRKANADGSNWSNFYAGFLHNGGVSETAPGSTIGLAYGFAYDDQGGNDPTLVSFATSVDITLKPLVNPPPRTAKKNALRLGAGT